MKNQKIDRIMGGIVVVLGGSIMIGAWRMPRFDNLNASPWEFVGLTPMVIGFCLAVCGGILAVRKLHIQDVQRGTPPHTETGYFEAICASPRQLKRFLSALVLTLLYGGVLFGRVDFIWATAGFIFAFFMVFTCFLPPETLKKCPLQVAIIKSLVLAVMATAGIYLLFETVFLVPLP